ncbi:MAG: Hint domain-containing protein [Acetobacter orientalis]|uniref:Hint domain-containing protein n=1 Tax=Acetobacter orientalis TaxID=146474 RepID=UPI0039E8F44F
MSIPLSGSYKLNVIQLSSWGYLNGRAQYVIGASGGGSTNVNSPQVDVTFDGKIFSFVDSLGQQQKITYNLVAGSGEYHYNSVIVKGVDSGVWWLLSAEPESCTPSGQIITHGFERDLSDRSDWHFGPRIYNITKSDTPFNAGSVVCFLTGTLLKTPNGLVPVEDLHLHDEVVVYRYGKEQVGHVVCLRKGHAVTRPELMPDTAGYPVHITKNAIAKGVPSKDLLFTAEQRLLFKGRFVPARLLVNNRSIFYDKSLPEYDFVHVEIEEHAAIMANGVLTESDCQKRQSQHNGQTGSVVSFERQSTKQWGQEAAAPLEVDYRFVEPLYQKLLRRAEKLHVPIQQEALPLTTEIALHLVTDTGKIVRLARKQDGYFLFLIPGGVQAVRIVSNASRPCDVIGPYIDDRRYFGVAIGEIKIFRKNKPQTITEHLSVDDLSGWLPLETPAARWTTGNALLPIGQGKVGEIALLSLQVLEAGPYVQASTPEMAEHKIAS